MFSAYCASLDGDKSSTCRYIHSKDSHESLKKVKKKIELKSVDGMFDSLISILLTGTFVALQHTANTNSIPLNRVWNGKRMPIRLEVNLFHKRSFSKSNNSLYKVITNREKKNANGTSAPFDVDITFVVK